MAKVTAPLLSFGGRGQIGKSIVFATWKGRPYTRQLVTPENPDTLAQQATRGVFRVASDLWKVMGALSVAPWEAFASGKVLTGRNAFIGRFVETLRGDLDLTDLVLSPGARGGLPQDSTTLTPGAGQVQVQTTNPTPPTGWTLVSMIAAAIPDGDPAALTDVQVVEGQDATTQNDVTLTGLSAGDWAVGAWLEWQKPDGRTAYGVSAVSIVTVT